MNSSRQLLNLKVALDALKGNRMRSLLTALGIIFGVAAVIAMLSIGRGAKQEILDQIKLVGVNNIVITSKMLKEEDYREQEEGAPQGVQENRKSSPGLSLDDVRAIRTALPHLEAISPEVVSDVLAIRRDRSMTARLVGVEPGFFGINNFQVVEGGNFAPAHLEGIMSVCIIGHNVRERFFGNQDPIGLSLKAGDEWFTVVGVLAQRSVTEAAITNLGLRDFNNDIYIPLNTMLLRVSDRGRPAVEESGVTVFGGGMMVTVSDVSNGNKNYNQLDKIVVQVEDTRYLEPMAAIIDRMLQRRHQGVPDYEITVPELLLKQQQRTKSIFNIVLGAIAGISLLVGGIGIMNIMLASVLERIKEIGIRMALGARKTDIVAQFIMEAVLISLSGGIIGIVLGVLASWGISVFTDILTIISIPSIFLSFGIAFAIGLVFGIAPARKAARQDPIESLRHE